MTTAAPNAAATAAATAASAARVQSPAGRDAWNAGALGGWLWRRLGIVRPPDGWISAGLLALNMIIVVWSVEVADWAPTPSLALVILLGLLAALLLARIPVWGALLLPAGLLVGAVVVIWQMTAGAPDELQVSTAAQLFGRLGLWLQAARNEGISIDPLPFAAGLTIAAWLSGLLAGWAFFRYRNFWGVFALGSLGLLSNLTFLPQNASVYLAIYLFTGLLLAGWVQSVRSRQRWDAQGRIYDGHLGILTMSDSAVVALIALVAAFLLPVGGQWGPANSVYALTRAPLVSWEEDFNRLFAGLPARRPLPYRIWGDAMAFQGTINPTDTPVLQVSSPVGLYWKARSYATYTHEGWISEGTQLQEPGWQPEFSAPSADQERFNVSFQVVPNYDSRSVFAGGQTLGADRDIRFETFDSPRYVIDPYAGEPGADLPAALASAVNAVGAAVQADPAAADHSIARALSAPFTLESVERDAGGGVLKATVAETVPAQPDVLSVRTARGPADSGVPYRITASVSSAEPDDLRTADADYAPWVWSRYTALPGDMPPRVAELAASITADAATPYDQAVAVESYLKNNYAYNLAIDPPPFGSDGVDYFLFESRQGYSEYFGSAMTVLLRSVGIPARMVTGYTAGNAVPDSDVYIVADHHSHGWTEVYFNGYGWIPFEPTPGKSIPAVAAPMPDAAPAVGAGSGSLASDLPCEIEEDCEDEDDLLSDAGAGPTGGDTASWLTPLRRALPWAGGIAAAMLAAAGAGAVAWRMLLATPDDVPSAYRRLRRLSRLAALGPLPHQTPHQWADVIAAALPEQRAPVAAIVGAYARHTYAGRTDGDADADAAAGLIESWNTLRVPLLLYALRRRDTALRADTGRQDGMGRQGRPGG